MGFSFAAGTTDGPGAFDFKQGDDQGNAFWKLVGGFFKKPNEEQINCQYPKPILIDTGEMHEPYDWALSMNMSRCGNNGNGSNLEMDFHTRMQSSAVVSVLVFFFLELHKEKLKAAAALKSLQEKLEEEFRMEIERKESQTELELKKLKDLAKAELTAAIASEKASQIEKLEAANLNELDRIGQMCESWQPYIKRTHQLP